MRLWGVTVFGQEQCGTSQPILIGQIMWENANPEMHQFQHQLAPKMVEKDFSLLSKGDVNIYNTVYSWDGGK